MSSASEDKNLEVEKVIMCCLVSAATHQRVQGYVSIGICWICEQTEKTEETWRKKICFSDRSFTMNPIQSDARFNCCYTVRRQHQTPWHQDSTIYIRNMNSKTVWTLHWYCIVHWYWNQYKILESMAINWQWVSRPAASFVNNWQPFNTLRTGDADLRLGI